MKPSGTFHNTEGSTQDSCSADVVSRFMSPLDSYVNTHNPSGAINRQQHAVLENGCPHNRPNHTRDAVLSGNNGAVAEGDPFLHRFSTQVEGFNGKEAIIVNGATLCTKRTSPSLHGRREAFAQGAIQELLGQRRGGTGKVSLFPCPEAFNLRWTSGMR
jgi:hypothetical protein